MNQDDAMKDFVSLFLDRLLPNAAKHFKEGLERGTPKQNYEDLSGWYNSLPSDEKQNVLQAVGLSNNLLFYSVLCLLDGISGYGRSEGLLTHYSLFVDAYADMNSMETEQFVSRTKVNSNDSEEHYLHYVYKDMMDAKSKDDENSET